MTMMGHVTYQSIAVLQCGLIKQLLKLTVLYSNEPKYNIIMCYLSSACACLCAQNAAGAIVAC